MLRYYNICIIHYDKKLKVLLECKLIVLKRMITIQKLNAKRPDLINYL